MELHSESCRIRKLILLSLLAVKKDLETGLAYIKPPKHEYNNIILKGKRKIN